jgi:hypothetical protein
MKKLLFSIIALAISLTMYSCKDTTGPDDTATVTLRSELKNSTAKVSTTLFNSGIASSDIDSIQVKKIRILITEIKFHSTTESDVQKDQLFKSGPLLFVVDSTGSKLEIASGTLPSGAYNKMKFEIHRFESSVLSQYVNSILFRDFATSERFSVIVDGISFKNGLATRFQYKGTPNVNITVDFGMSVDFPANQESIFYYTIDANDFFRSNDEVYDPTDDSDRNDIDNLIKQALKIEKRNN